MPALKTPYNHGENTEVYRTHCEAIGRIIAAAVSTGNLSLVTNAIREYVAATNALTEK